MNKLTNEKRAQIVRCLVEGSSIRATCRLTDTAKGTVTKLLVEIGAACDAYQRARFHNLTCKRLQLDEIWSFVGCKEVNKKEAERGKFGRGDVWTWTAICADSKLIPSWLVSTRDAGAALEFVSDLRSRLASRVQITTDGHSAYLSAIEDAFGADVDYAQLVKLFGSDPADERRYSPAKVLGTRSEVRKGNPDHRHISTSYAERANLTLRMGNRRFTRLTNAFSKKVDNHRAALALHMAYYNLCRIHQTLRMTPAMAAGVESRLWDVEDLVALLD